MGRGNRKPSDRMSFSNCLHGRRQAFLSWHLPGITRKNVILFKQKNSLADFGILKKPCLHYYKKYPTKSNVTFDLKYFSS